MFDQVYNTRDELLPVEWVSVYPYTSHATNAPVSSSYFHVSGVLPQGPQLSQAVDDSSSPTAYILPFDAVKAGQKGGGFQSPF